MRRIRYAVVAWVVMGLSLWAFAMRPRDEAARMLGFSSSHFETRGALTGLYLSGPSRLTIRDAEQGARVMAGMLRRMGELDLESGILPVGTARYQGRQSYRFRQAWHGFPVIGAELTAQTQPDGQVVAVLGRSLPVVRLNLDAVQPFEGMLDGAVGRIYGPAAMMDPSLTTRILSGPELVVYAVDTSPTLAWSASIEVRGEGRFDLRQLYLDAATGDVVTSYPLIYTALERNVHDADGGCLASFGGVQLPGRQVMGEGDSSSDTAAQGAYDNTGDTYWFYWYRFGRDSWDGQGYRLVSTVHITFSTDGWSTSNCSPNNAAFLPDPYKQMVYGDGDGQILTTTSLALDVTAHELTHGVTSVTSNLAYQKESGAINESMSDVFGAGAEAWVDSLAAEGRDPAGGNPSTYRTFADTWKLGEDAAGPQIGEALRYMNDPAADGRSADYYPDRNYADCSSPSQSNDQCGVHTNSGIGNLAFYLLTEGGTHPRNKTTVQVPGIGIAKALSIFYEANTQLLNQNATWEDLRYATGQAAENQFGQGSCEWVAVMKAWDAVGVPGTWNNPGTCGGTQNQPPTARFTWTAQDLQVSFDGSSSSDPDGSIQSWSWDFGDGFSGTGRTVVHTYGTAGTYTVSLTVADADGATDTTSRSVSVTAGGGGGGGPCTDCKHYTGTLSGAYDSDYQPNGNYYRSSAGNHHGWLQGPAGADFDLYLYKWTWGMWWPVASSATAGSDEEVSYDGGSGYYVWEIFSYSGSGSYDFWLRRP